MAEHNQRLSFNVNSMCENQSPASSAVVNQHSIVTLPCASRLSVLRVDGVDGCIHNHNQHAGSYPSSRVKNRLCNLQQLGSDTALVRLDLDVL